MTDRQIVLTVLSNKINGLMIGYDDIRFYARANLSRGRCERIQSEIIKLLEDIRRPLVEELSRIGVDAT